MYFCSSNFEKTHRKESPFSDFRIVGWKSTEFLSYLKLQVSFYLKFASLFGVMRDNPSVFFFFFLPKHDFKVDLDEIEFWRKEPIKVKNFRLLTVPMKFYQICTLIAYFCWKYIKFQLKKYRGFMFHDTEDWCKIRRKTDLLYQKWQEFGEFWPEHSKFSKVLLWLAPFVQSI